MQKIRKQIDQIDQKILNLIAKRYSLALKLADQKKQNNLPIQDKKREEKILANIVKKAKKLSIAPEHVQKLFKQILKESRRVQKNVEY